ncbi:transposase, partial [bacterium]|nr:transposase [bacterium]
KAVQIRTVKGEDFLWLLIQHILPKGFRKARNYGFLHPCSKKMIKLLQLILNFRPVLMYKNIRKRSHIICKSCGAKMLFLRTMLTMTDVQQIVFGNTIPGGGYAM